MGNLLISNIERI
ncbi:hypothetical protein F383_20957 [Gossypium arboreum]|uniref:Uncharacterized protein n=1 Tax=Gossypium arboreum TaxID=29729 RepID=A0A0B0NW82_GOSAR|nr:hypothetical protein F383_20957 [Gossypium arboreum]